MKITLISLIVGLSLVAASANNGIFVDSDELDFEYSNEDSTDEIVDIKVFGFRKVIKAALRSVKGLNCSIKAALIMKDASEQGLQNIQACGGQVSRKLKKVINVLNTIVNICNDIINLKSNICKADEENENANTTGKCFVKVARKMFSLYRNTRRFIKLVKTLPSDTTDAGSCVATATMKVSNTFMQFPDYIVKCSKLTSN